MTIYIKLIIFTSLIFCAFSMNAQKVLDLTQYQEKYEDEKAIILEQSEVIDIKIINGELDIKKKHFSDKVVIGESARGYLDEYIHYNETFNVISDIDGKTLYPNGKKYRSSKITEIKKESQISRGIFYDDNKVMRVHSFGSYEGCRTKISYIETIKDPHFLGAYFFANFLNIEKSVIEVNIPKEIEITYKIFNDTSDLIKFTKTENGNLINYKWEAKEIKKFEQVDNAPNFNYYVPHIILYINSYKVDGERKEVLNDVKSLYNWYTTLIDSTNIVDPSEELKNIVDSLITEKDTDLEKVKKIYYWVQSNIKYVAFEDGMGGFIPREASHICTRRYGDCKDMSSITTEMLEIAGIKSSLTWIGTRHLPYDYTDVPTPNVDNHMIASVEIDGKRYFLDATGQYQPLGIHTSFIQGKQALIAIDKDNFKVERVPVLTKEESVLYDSTIIYLGNDSIHGQGYSKYEGYYLTELGYFLRRRSDSKRKEFLESYLEKGSNRFQITKQAYSGLENRDDNIEVNYEFEIPSYSKTLENNIYVNLNLDKSFQGEKIEDEREIALEIDNKSIEKNIVALEIPQGYSIDYMPENTDFKNDKFGYKIDYKLDNNKLIMRRQIYIDALLLNKSDFKDWNDMIKKLSKSYKEVVVLKKD